MHLGWSWLGLLAAYFWASSLWWLLDARATTATDCRDPHYVPWHRRYACLAWFTQDVASHVSAGGDG